MNTRPCPKCGDQPNVYSVGDNKQLYMENAAGAVIHPRHPMKQQ